MKRARVWSIVCFIVGCAAERDANRPVEDAEPPKLLAQRVTGTVKREAATLVHLSTEHEALITTPEHPFATPGSGWIRAGQLAPGDRVVSARFGVVRVLSVQSETPEHPVTVFNLSVNASHAYLVGKDQVLVHNTNCQDGKENALRQTLEELDREIEGLQTALTSAENKTEIQKRLDELVQERKKIRSELHYTRKYAQKRRVDPEWKEADLRAKQRSRQGAAYVADTEPRRDTFELMQQELAALREQPASASRDQRISQLSDAIETRRRLLKMRKREAANVAILRNARRKRQALIEQREDTRTIDQTITRLQQELAANRAERDELRYRRLAGSAAAQEAVQDEAEDVDAVLMDLAESIRTSPSPERTAAVASSLQALQDELREERRAAEAADLALANEQAFLSQTSARPGSSSHATGAERLAVQQQRLELRTRWRERMQRRLDGAQQDLRTMQSLLGGFRDEALEADLAQQIARLEHEVEHPSF